MIVLLGVEAKILNVVFMAGPDDGSAEAHCKASLKVNIATMASEVGYQESTLAYLSYDLVINLLVVFYVELGGWIRCTLRHILHVNNQQTPLLVASRDCPAQSNLANRCAEASDSTKLLAAP